VFDQFFGSLKFCGGMRCYPVQYKTVSARMLEPSVKMTLPSSWRLSIYTMYQVYQG